MRLKYIEINGFRRKNVVAKISLDSGQFSFMYGQNGIGKTTLLELIYAIFDKNEKKMISENVESVKIGIIDDSSCKEIYVSSYYEDNEKYYDWENFDDNGLDKFNILYITTQRALNEYRENITVDMLAYYLQNNKEVSIDYLSPYHDLSNLCNFINGMHDEEIIKHINGDNVYINSLRISDVGKLIYNYYFKCISELEETKTKIVSNILKICLDYMDERDKYLKSESGIIFKHSSQLSKFEKEVLTELLGSHEKVITRVLESENRAGVSYSVTSKVKSEINKYIISVNPIKSLSLFKDLTGKEVSLTNNSVRIKFKEESHDLTKLSHGERHLLTLLSLVDFIGNNKNIILIDEPCIALDTDWQEKLAETFSKITKVPFLIATHSPSISEDYLDNQIQIFGGLK
jgi:ABC-type lipoprotein export system ATPase subunit